MRVVSRPLEIKNSVPVRAPEPSADIPVFAHRLVNVDHPDAPFFGSNGDESPHAGFLGVSTGVPFCRVGERDSQRRGEVSRLLPGV